MSPSIFLYLRYCVQCTQWYWKLKNNRAMFIYDQIISLVYQVSSSVQRNNAMNFSFLLICLVFDAHTYFEMRDCRLTCRFYQRFPLSQFFFLHKHTSKMCAAEDQYVAKLDEFCKRKVRCLDSRDRVINRVRTLQFHISSLATGNEPDIYEYGSLIKRKIAPLHAKSRITLSTNMLKYVRKNRVGHTAELRWVDW